MRVLIFFIVCNFNPFLSYWSSVDLRLREKFASALDAPKKVKTRTDTRTLSRPEIIFRRFILSREFIYFCEKKNLKKD